MAKVIAPSGGVFRSTRPYQYAVLVGPCGPEEFVQRVEEMVAVMQGMKDLIVDAIERGKVMSNGDESWLDGWYEYHVVGTGDGEVLSYMYAPGEVETGETRESAKIVDVLRNHAGAEVVRLSNRIVLTQGMADRVRGGSTVELGGWHVARWCINLADATRAIRVFEDQRGPWGCEVVVKKCGEW